MRRDTLTGSRIRERRTILGMKQAHLAKSCGISASYLNLIEHNRRRIAGKLLLDIARVLDVDPGTLTTGAQADVLADLQRIGAGHSDLAPELEQAEEFAGRFPGWVNVMRHLSRQHRRLEYTVSALNDRLTHEPHLAEALHEMLGAVTAIRSTSSILADTDELEKSWRDRFYRNLKEDARRLSEGSQALVSFLDRSDENHSATVTPQDDVEALFARQGGHIEALEHIPQDAGQDDDSGLSALAEQLGQELRSDAARRVLRTVLAQYASDAAQLPLTPLLNSLARHGVDPMALTESQSVPFDLVLRRLSHLSADHLRPYLPQIDERGLGFVTCDSSGAILQRKQVTGLNLPRFGASCPMWVLYQALSRPMTPLMDRISLGPRYLHDFECYGYAVPQTGGALNRAPVFVSHMLVVPQSRQDAAGPVQDAGQAKARKQLSDPAMQRALDPDQGAGVCRICKSTQCRSLADVFGQVQ